MRTLDAIIRIDANVDLDFGVNDDGTSKLIEMPS